jgi:hypothetical protein
MKSSFALLFSLLAASFIYAEGSSNNSEYFICRFNETVTTSELNELKQQGFQVFEKDSTANVVYVKAKKSNPIFTEQLKEKMKELIMVDENGNKIYMVETVKEDSPEFLKLFFNFI